MKNFILVTVLCLALQSCSLILSSMYGYNDMSDYSESDYHSFVDGLDKMENVNFVVADSLHSFDYLNLAQDSIWKKNFAQPIQFLFFKNDSLYSYHANCFAKGGVKNIDWNYQGRFNNCKPVSAVSLDSMKMSEALFLKTFKLSEGDVYIIWSRLFENLAEESLRFISNYTAKCDSSITVTAINVDLFYASSLKH